MRRLPAHFLEQFDALPELEASGAQPLALGFVMDLRHQRPAYLHGEIPARRGQPVLVGVVALPVVVDVDAAHEGELAVDHHDLAVRTRDAALAPGVEDAVLHAGSRKRRAQA